MTLTPLTIALVVEIFAAILATSGDAAAASPHNPTSAPINNDQPLNPVAPTLDQGFSGSVRDETGQPIAGALIVPRSLQTPAPAIPELAILSDLTGRYTWPLPPGDYELTVTAEDYETVQQRGSIVEGAVTTLDIGLTRKE